jgi:hypothetical protein
MRHLLPALLSLFAATLPATHAQDYSIQAIRVANSPGDSVADMVMGAPKDQKIDTIYALWLIRGGGHNILFDSGFHRDRWFKLWTIKDYLRPDEAVRQAGIKPEDVTDVVISHAHWDHMGGIDLFPRATVWIQKDEFRYYTGEAWQAGGDHGGIDPEDVQELVKLNTEGRLRLVDGDNVEFFPGFAPTPAAGIPTRRNISASQAIHHLYSRRTTSTCTAISRSTPPAPRSPTPITPQT